MKRINSRSKGIRGERDVIDRLQPIVDKCYANCGKQAPVLQRNTLQYDSGGSDIAGLEFLAIEIKNCATLAPDVWWIQCQLQAHKNHRNQTPILIYKAVRGKFRVRAYGMIGSWSGTNFDCIVEISWEEFLVWFERRLLNEIQQDLFLKSSKPAKPAKPNELS